MPPVLAYEGAVRGSYQYGWLWGDGEQANCTQMLRVDPMSPEGAEPGVAVPCVLVFYLGFVSNSYICHWVDPYIVL